MGVEYCTRCGEAHEPPRQRNCTRSRILPDRATRSKSVSTEGATAMSTMEAEKPITEAEMDEEELALHKQVETARAERRKLALKRKLLELQADNVRETESQAAGKPSGQPDPTGQPTGPSPGDGPWRDIPPTRDETQEEVGRQTKIRSKFDISPYIEEKDHNKLSFPELVLASMNWGVDYEWGSQEEVKGFLAHMGYIAMKTVGDHYLPKANMEYDKSIRKAAGNRGVKAFCGGNWDISMAAYRYENTWQAQREKAQRESARRHEEATEEATGGAAGVAEATHTPLSSSSSSIQVGEGHARHGTWTKEAVTTAIVGAITHACTAGIHPTEGQTARIRAAWHSSKEGAEMRGNCQRRQGAQYHKERILC